MRGIDRIRQAIRPQGRPALMPYFPIGYPDLSTSIDIIAACCRAGADIMELGVPFSDPLADGPTIQRSTQVALEKGITVAGCLKAVRELRGRGANTPFLLMGYVNPILRYGQSRFLSEAARAGADGFIVPDLPPEEAAEFDRGCREAGLSHVYLVAPNSTDERIRIVVEASSSFIYLVSVLGITGARAKLPPQLHAFISRVRTAAGPEIPIAVGFGIATPDQAASVSAAANGVIVGSALIERVDAALLAGGDPTEAAAEFVAELSAAIE